MQTKHSLSTVSEKKQDTIINDETACTGLTAPLNKLVMQYLDDKDLKITPNFNYSENITFFNHNPFEIMATKIGHELILPGCALTLFEPHVKKHPQILKAKVNIPGFVETTLLGLALMRGDVNTPRNKGIAEEIVRLMCIHLPNGHEIASKQAALVLRSQTLEEKETKKSEGSKALETIFKAIVPSDINPIPDYKNVVESAKNKFKEYLKPKNLIADCSYNYNLLQFYADALEFLISKQKGSDSFYDPLYNMCFRIIMNQVQRKLPDQDLRGFVQQASSKLFDNTSRVIRPQNATELMPFKTPEMIFYTPCNDETRDSGDFFNYTEKEPLKDYHQNYIDFRDTQLANFQVTIKSIHNQSKSRCLIM